METINLNEIERSKLPGVLHQMGVSEDTIANYLAITEGKTALKARMTPRERSLVTRRKKRDRAGRFAKVGIAAALGIAGAISIVRRVRAANTSGLNKNPRTPPKPKYTFTYGPGVRPMSLPNLSDVRSYYNSKYGNNIYGGKARRGRGPDPRKIRRDRLGRFAGYAGSIAGGVGQAVASVGASRIGSAVGRRHGLGAQFASTYGVLYGGNIASHAFAQRSRRGLKRPKDIARAEKLQSVARNTAAIGYYGYRAAKFLSPYARRGFARARAKRNYAATYRRTSPVGNGGIGSSNTINANYRFLEYAMKSSSIAQIVLKRTKKPKAKEIGFKHPGHPNQKVHAAQHVGRAIVRGTPGIGIARAVAGQAGSHAKRSASNTKKVGRAARAYGRNAVRQTKRVVGGYGRRVASQTKKRGQGARNYLSNFYGGSKELDFEIKTKEVKATAFVFKEEHEGQEPTYRWVLLSSNGYRDRDGEIIATKALERDVALWELDGEPPHPLRMWHIALSDDYREGIELGTKDFRMVQGRTLVESGTFLTKEIAEGVYNAQNELAASIGFRYSTKDVTSDKVIEAVEIFETSLLPKGENANILTHLAVV